MIDLAQCSHCLHLNPMGASMCESCGNALEEERIEVANPDHDTARLLDNEEDQLSSIPVALATTHRVDPGPEENEPRWGGAQIDDTTRVIAHVLHYDQTVNIEIHRTGSVILGRTVGSDDESTYLDLSGFEPTELGVSRQHARFDLKDYSLYVVDLASTNGTYLNGLRILPNQRRIVRDGDEIRLGRLRLQILFTHALPQTD